MMITQNTQLKIVMIMTYHQIFTRRKINHEPLNDFDSDEDNDGDNKIYQEKVWELTDQRHVNFTAIISSIRVEPKYCLLVLLCRMVSMPIMPHALKGNITKLEANFFNSYHDGDYVTYIPATDFKWDFQFVNDKVRASWSPHWTQINDVFESQLDSDPSFISYNNKMFFI